MYIQYDEEINLVHGILAAADFPEEDASIMAKVVTIPTSPACIPTACPA